MRIFGLLVITLALSFSAASQAANPKVEIRTSLGNLVVELYSDKAPKTVDNFLRYVKDGHYRNTVFHRVIPGFMVQGGGFDKSLAQKPTRQPVGNEAANGLRNDIGTIAMARTSDPNSATAQFFINVANNTFLNHTSPTPRGYGYTVFGKVINGMDVVEKIAAVPTAARGPFPGDVPRTDVVIEEIRLIADGSLSTSNPSSK
jgi:peptidyl-prolyl cis-trans isomerase A (cyclophilin A)/peptidyl-prolyl cis-trans isomerase B (cyclophilin B)